MGNLEFPANLALWILNRPYVTFCVIFALTRKAVLPLCKANRSKSSEFEAPLDFLQDSSIKFILARLFTILLRHTPIAARYEVLALKWL